MNIADTLITLPRRYKQLIMLLADFIALPICFVASVFLRLGASPTGNVYQPLQMQITLLWYALAVTVISIPLLYVFGLYRSVLGYLDFKTATKSVLAVMLAALTVYGVSHIKGINPFPRSAILIFLFVAFSYLMCSRYVALVLLHHQRKLTTNAKRVAIWGAGAAGAQTVAALRNTADYLPLCFFDSNPTKETAVIAGLRVYPPADLIKRLTKLDIQQVVIAMPSAGAAQRQSVLNQLANLPAYLHVTTLILPGINDLIDGKITVSRLRNVALEDLLGRDAIAPDAALFDRCIGGKTILVSGAGGSIGSELCRQILNTTHQTRPTTLIALERNEYALYTLEQELSALAKTQGTAFVACLGDAGNQAVLDALFGGHKIDTVYHAAAYKHVPLVEANPCVGVANNVTSTLALVKASAQHEVAHFILISTDKAVRPTNVMGASKRVAEQVVQAYAEQSATQGKRTVFCMVRFGNVLGSSGSVIPKFMTQIAAGGPVTVTHPEIIRYFMLIPEAAQLVIQAGAMAQGGEVFVLDMGEPVKIIDLAAQAITLTGHTLRNASNPTGEIAIEFSGLRPGEKLYEELLIGDNSQPSQHPRILQAQESFMIMPELMAAIDTMLLAAKTNDPTLMLSYLKHIVPEFNHAK
jgi:FlaA1/EpsC-like NDP-sugar epimerase